jgi:hypothetical protein
MFKSIHDLFSDSKDIIIERIKSPLLSSFGIAWLFFNWKIVLLLLFSNKGIEDKIKEIDQLTSICNGLWFPGLIAIFYTIIYPFINYAIFMAHNQFEKKVEILRAENAIEVLDTKIKQVQKESTLEQNRFNAQRKLEREKLDNEYDLERQKLEVEKKRLDKEELVLRRSIAAQTAP